jgi:diadenosine tetraphosphate (Ap4A) HIT family hydrolase
MLREIARPGSHARLVAMLLRKAGEKIGLRRMVEDEGGARRDDCIFCHRNDQSLNRIMCENSGFFARYDNFPAAPGHVEIVPKCHIESFFDLNDQEVIEAYSLLVEAQQRIVKEYDPPDGYTIGINEGRAAGRSVDHLHIHLIPRYAGDVADPRGGIRQAAPNCDPDDWR